MYNFNFGYYNINKETNLFPIGGTHYGVGAPILFIYLFISLNMI